jgi:hypothetical protein
VAAPELGGGPELWGHVVAPELPRADSGSPSHGDTWQPRSYPEPGVGARAAGTRGGPGAAPSWEREPEPWGHMVALKLPSAGRREPLSWLEACTRGYPVLKVPTVTGLLARTTQGGVD